MRITRVEPIVLRVAQVDTGRADGTQDAFIVRIHTDDGIVGVGEADTSPYVARTMIEMPSSHAIARSLGELLVGKDPLQIERLWQLLFHGSDHYGRGGAALHTISAIDIALWDIAGKASGRPVAELLGGPRVVGLPVYASEVMPETAAEVRVIAESAVANGYSALKLGWGPLGGDLDRDEELVRAARTALGPTRSLMIDGGRAYTVKRALEFLRRVEDVDLYWFEEPLEPDDYEGYRRLSDRTDMRIAAGEADAGIAPFRELVERSHVDVLQPDVARCGGFSVARQIADLARGKSVEVVPHCFSTGVLVAASLHFAATLDRPTFSEFSVADSPLVNGLLTECAPGAPGLEAVRVGVLRLGSGNLIAKRLGMPADPLAGLRVLAEGLVAGRVQPGWAYRCTFHLPDGGQWLEHGLALGSLGQFAHVPAEVERWKQSHLGLVRWATRFVPLEAITNIQYGLFSLGRAADVVLRPGQAEWIEVRQAGHSERLRLLAGVLLKFELPQIPVRASCQFGAPRLTLGLLPLDSRRQLLGALWHWRDLDGRMRKYAITPEAPLEMRYLGPETATVALDEDTITTAAQRLTWEVVGPLNFIPGWAVSQAAQ